MVMQIIQKRVDIFGEIEQLLLESFREWLYKADSLVRYQTSHAVVLDETGHSTDSNTHNLQLIERAWVLSLSPLVTVSTVASILVLKKKMQMIVAHSILFPHTYSHSCAVKK